MRTEFLHSYYYGNGRTQNGDSRKICRQYKAFCVVEEEMHFKIKNANALTELFDDAFSDIVDINRKNYCVFMLPK